jgi:hypothetical protein
MSFLDCMSCGFGAVILFFMIINSHVNATTENDNSELMAETNRLEIEVLEGRKNLALARNTKQKLEVEKEEAESKIAQIIALIQELQAELDKYDQDTLAKIERVEKLQSDIKSLEEEVKRLLAIKREQDAAGEQIREFRGEGDRQYLTGLRLGGERTLILVDRSASMLSDTLVNIIRRRNLPEAEQLRSRKWRQVNRRSGVVRAFGSRQRRDRSWTKRFVCCGVPSRKTARTCIQHLQSPKRFRPGRTTSSFSLMACRQWTRPRQTSA